MINKITLKNFQSHRNNTFDFIDGINVILGQSGIGKSSVIRALSYIFTNKKSNGVKYESRPDATGFEIEVVVDGHSIKRVKSTKENEYHIDGEVYRDIGTSVPDKVYSISNISPIKVGSDEFNVQLAKQFDPHFLMFLSDSLKVKFLNRLSGSHILDIALKETNKDLNAVDKDKISNENELNIVQSNINHLLDIVDPIKLVVKDAREKYDALIDSNNRVNDLKVVKSHMDSYNAQKREFDAIHAIIDNVNIEGFEFKINKLNDLYNVKNSYDSNMMETKHVKDIIEKIDKIDVKQLESRKNILDSLKSLWYNYTCIKSDMDKVNEELHEVNRKILNSISEVKDFLTNTPKCPTCNTTITKSKIDKIIKELEQ